MQPDLSIIIVSWNTRELLTRCLESLPIACGSLNYEVWVVDNASVDGSTDLVREQFPWVKLIANDKNLGFAAANNQACRDAKGRHLLLLNPDTESTPNSIAGLVAYADAHPEIGALGPRLLNTDGSDQRSCWRGYPGLGKALVDALYLWRLPWLSLTWVSDYRPSELKTPRAVDHLLGACILIRRSAWDQVGPLDERYFLGSEETDWCYRAKRAGWQIFYHPDLRVTHHGQRSTWQQPSTSLPRLYAGICQFYTKHHETRIGYAFLRGILALGALVRVGLWATRMVSARQTQARSEAKAMIRGYLEVMCRLPTYRRHILSQPALTEGARIPALVTKDYSSHPITPVHQRLNIDSLRCPECLGSLRQVDEALICNECSAQWQVREGIPILSKREFYWGFADRAKAQAINTLATEKGWQVAAREYALTEHPKRYDYYYEYISSEARADFSILANLTPESRVLDVGSGWGNLAAGLARVAGEVYALDTTVENLKFVAIRSAQEGLSNVQVVNAEATCLPFQDEFFDLIVMNGVLEWVGTSSDVGSPLDLQRQALLQAWRKLKPGGKLYVGIENRWGIVYFAGRADPHTGLRFVTLMPRFLADFYSRLVQKKPYRAWTYSRADLEKMLRQAGFARVDCYYPIPGYQNYRFLAAFESHTVFKFLLTNLLAFPRFSKFLYVLANLSLLAGGTRLIRWVYPSFAILGSKEIA